MNQLNLLKTKPESVNLDALNKEIPGTIAIILDESGKFQGVDQKGNMVDVASAPVAPAPPAQDATIDAKMEESIVTKVGENINDGLTKMLNDQAAEIKTEQEKALDKVVTELVKNQEKELKLVSKAFTDQLGKLQAEITKLKEKPKSTTK